MCKDAENELLDILIIGRPFVKKYIGTEIRSSYKAVDETARTLHNDKAFACGEIAFGR